jgi:type II secretory pathway component PulL
MRDHIILITPVNKSLPLSWAQCSGLDVVSSGDIALSELNLLAEKNLPISLVVPGQNVQTFTHDLPKMNRREREKAVLFSIEDKVSTPVESLHAVLNDTNTQTVTVIDKYLMQEIVTWANENDLQVKSIIADYDALALSDASPIALQDRVIFPGPLGHSLDLDWYDGDRAEIESEALFSLITKNLSNTTNLRQGEFAPKRQFGAKGRVWMKMAGMAAALGLAVLVFEGMNARAVKAQAQDIHLQTQKLYTQATGQNAPDNPARAVIQAQKNGQVTPTQFLVLSDIAFAALDDFEDVTIERLNFQDSRNELQMRLIYPSFERADQVKRAMEIAGGHFVPGGVREQSGRFVGEAVLKLKGGA